MTVGLTGGIGSGKSTVCRMFERLGVPIIDADVVARELVEPGQPALSALVELLGSEVLDADGRLNRARVREVVFHDPGLRAKVEGLLHPLIRAEMQQRVSALVAPYCIQAIPLLVETGQASSVDRLLLIDLPVDLQIERTLARDSGSRETVQAIIEAQASREQRLALAGDVIDNNADLEAVRRRVHDLHQRYMAASAGRHLPVRRHQ